MNKIIIAAAGSGKTTHLVDEAIRLNDKKILITTYTEDNSYEIKRKFYECIGYVPQNVTILPWFSFLLQEGVRPYQSYLWDSKICNMELVNGRSTTYIKKEDTKRYYFNKSAQIYSDKIAHFIVQCNEMSKNAVFERLELIYDYIFVDELQDITGEDLEILKFLLASKIGILLVGDPRQSTLHTNHSAKNKNYYGTKMISYFVEIQRKYNIEIDETSLNTNHRCDPIICNISNQLYPDLPNVLAREACSNNHRGLYFVKPTDIETYLNTYKCVQLRNDKTKFVSKITPVFNFKKSKGLTFDRVLIYPTKDMLNWLLNSNKHNCTLSNGGRCNLYIALTRAVHSVAVVYDFDNTTEVPYTKYIP